MQETIQRKADELRYSVAELITIIESDDKEKFDKKLRALKYLLDELDYAVKSSHARKVVSSADLGHTIRFEKNAHWDEMVHYKEKRHMDRSNHSNISHINAVHNTGKISHVKNSTKDDNSQHTGRFINIADATSRDNDVKKLESKIGFPYVEDDKWSSDAKVSPHYSSNNKVLDYSNKNADNISTERVVRVTYDADVDTRRTNISMDKGSYTSSNPVNIQIDVAMSQSDLELYKCRKINKIPFLIKPIQNKGVNDIFEGSYLERFCDRRTEDLMSAACINQHNAFWNQHTTINGNVYASVPLELLTSRSVEILKKLQWNAVDVDIYDFPKNARDAMKMTQVCKNEFENFILVLEHSTNDYLVLVFP